MRGRRQKCHVRGLAQMHCAVGYFMSFVRKKKSKTNFKIVGDNVIFLRQKGAVQTAKEPSTK